MNLCRKIKPYFLLFAGLVSGCTLLDDDSASKRLSKSGLIATPASYYSTAKARYLGAKYKDNLDRLTERIVRNSNTAHLQFANNISSVGGIGFFTHSATKTSDERYLEIVLATPENFETKGQYSDKVNQLFSRYGQDLLAILAGDSQMYQDKELAGYGLNLTWRNVMPDATANRVTSARAIIYFHKDRVSNFLRRDISQNELLRDAVIFAMEEDGPVTLVSYQAQETKADFRPAIREDNLSVGGSGPESTGLPASAEAVKDPNKSGLKVETAKQAAPAVREAKSRAVASQPTAAAEKSEVKAAPAAAQKDPVPALRPVEKLGSTPEKSPATKRDAVAEKLALAKPVAEAPPVVAPGFETSPEPVMVPPASPELTVERRAEPIKTPPAASAVPETKSRAIASQPTAAAEKSEVKAAPAAAQKNPVPALRPVEKLGSTPEKSPATKRDAVAEKLALAKPVAEAPPALVFEANPEPTVEKAEPIETPRSNRTSAMDLSPNDSRVQPGRNEATSTVAQLKKVDSEPQLVKDAETPPTAVLVAKPAAEIKEQGSITVPAPSAKLPAPARPAEAKLAGPPASAAKAANRQPVIDPVPRPLAPTSRATEVEKATESSPVADSKAAEAPRPLPETLAVPLKAKAPTPRETKPAEATVKEASQEKQAEMKDRADAPVLAKNTMPKPDLEKSPEIKAADATAVGSSAEKLPAQKVEAPTPASGVAPGESHLLVDKPPAQEKAAEKPLPEQIALLKKPMEPSVDKKPLARPEPKSLEGFIIQIAFNDKHKAQSWAEKMAQRGYAVSVTEAGAEGSLRVRLGNFSIREEAERQLRNFKQEGMSGIIINLPQAFRPEARSSLP